MDQTLLLAANSQPPVKPVPKSVIEAIKDQPQIFNIDIFRERLSKLRDQVINDGGIVFIPLVWGIPSTRDAYPENGIIEVNTANWNLLAPGINLLQGFLPRGYYKGGIYIDDFQVEDIPLTQDQINVGISMVSSFEEMKDTENKSSINFREGVTTMIDPNGRMYISFNSPTSLPLKDPENIAENEFKYNMNVPVPAGPNLATRLFYSAYLKEIGLNDDEIYSALNIPIGLEGDFKLRRENLHIVESDYSDLGIAMDSDAQLKHRQMFSSARFDDRGNIVYEHPTIKEV
jgi:hypothetical protein